MLVPDVEKPAPTEAWSNEDQGPEGPPDKEIDMNTNSYLNTAITAHLIDERVCDARSRSLVAVARRRSRKSRIDGADELTRPTRRQWFSRPVTA